MSVFDLNYTLKNGKKFDLQVIICSDYESKKQFYRACQYYKKQEQKGADVVMSFDLEYGQNKIGLMQVKFDIITPSQEYNVSNDIFLIDPYQFQENHQEKLIFTFFVRQILCSDKIYKVAHGIYSLDFDNIKQQLLCGLPQEEIDCFMYNLLDTRIFSQYLIYKNNIITKYSGNDVYTMYLTQNILDSDQVKIMTDTEFKLNLQKQKGFSINMQNMNIDLVQYAVNDVVFLYQSMCLQKPDSNTSPLTSINEFKGICQTMYFLTKIRKDYIQMSKVKYSGETIKKILQDADNIEFKTTTLAVMFKNFLQYFKITDFEKKTVDPFIALYNIEQAKIIPEILFKINLYTDKIPKDQNQFIYNLRNNFSEFLKLPRFQQFAQLYNDFQNKCKNYQSIFRKDDEQIM